MVGSPFPIWIVALCGSQISTETIWLLMRPFWSFLAMVSIKYLWCIVFMVKIGVNVGLLIQVTMPLDDSPFESAHLASLLIQYFDYNFLTTPQFCFFDN